VEIGKGETGTGKVPARMRHDFGPFLVEGRGRVVPSILARADEVTRRIGRFRS
jgi:hypothetical protein